VSLEAVARRTPVLPELANLLNEAAILTADGAKMPLPWQIDNAVDRVVLVWRHPGGQQE